MTSFLKARTLQEGESGIAVCVGGGTGTHSRFPGDDLRPNGGLDGHFIQLAVDDTLQSLASSSANRVGTVSVDYCRQHVYWSAV